VEVNTSLKNSDLPDLILHTWRTNNRVTESFIAHLPQKVWETKIPGSPRKSVQMLAGHIHNSRCMWIKMIGRSYGIKPPASVDRRTVTRRELLSALKKSNLKMTELLKRGLEENGTLRINIPWANIPSDAVHFMTYIAAHEAHHRGQIVLAARAANLRLPREETSGLWQWKKLHKEARNRKKTGSA
jgi:uncharacterized damage-inducible protein DinB